MSQEYDIFSKDDFNKMVNKFNHYFIQRKSKGLDFQPIKIISKRWQKPKTSKQHRTFFRAIGELKKAFINAGYDTNENEVIQFVKQKAGYTTTLEGVMITKSVADASDDATNKNLKHLIDFIVRFAQEKLDYHIEID
mgnify:CR=1 FL=1